MKRKELCPGCNRTFLDIVKTYCPRCDSDFHLAQESYMKMLRRWPALGKFTFAEVFAKLVEKALKDG